MTTPLLTHSGSYCYMHERRETPLIHSRTRNDIAARLVEVAMETNDGAGGARRGHAAGWCDARCGAAGAGTEARARAGGEPTLRALAFTMLALLKRMETPTCRF